MAINAANMKGITMTLADLIPANTTTKAAKTIKLLFTPVKPATLFILLFVIRPQCKAKPNEMK